MTESDEIWLEDKDRNHWVMPRATWWKRLPIVRHVRATYHGNRARRFRQMTSAMGLGIGGIPQFDRWVIYGIAKGYERPSKGGAE